MSLRDEIIAGVREVYTEIADAVESIQYESLDLTAGSTYDPSTGEFTPVHNTGSPFTVTEALLYSSEKSLIELALTMRDNLSENVEIDQKIIIIQDDLEVVPKKTDTITTSADVFKVEGFRQDPLKAIWIFDLVAGV